MLRYLRLFPLCLAVLFFAQFASAQEVTEDRNFIRVDQFGYLPEATKVAVIAKAVDGYNAGTGIDVDPGAEVALIDAVTGERVYTAYPKLWNGGSVDPLSGDKGAWFDFTEVTTAGTYRIRVQHRDSTTTESYDFRIGDDAYDEVMRAAVNVFYYQRFNQDKTAEYASGEPWTDGPWFDRPDQDYAVKELDNPTATRDLSGGWFDAGDPNKYVTFAVDAVHALLTAYDLAPAFWDDFGLNIPESGNDTPDLLDEIKFEIDWIKKMQSYDPDAETAGIIQKMGILEDDGYVSPPSVDTRDRWHNGICVSSSITGAGMLAHAAAVYRRAGVWPEEVAELTDRAAKAYAYYEQAEDKTERCDDGRIEAGDADGPGDIYATEHLALAAAAAVYLFELTGEAKYNDFIAANFQQTRPWKAEDWSIYRAHQGEALLHYTSLNGADEATKTAILDLKASPAKSTTSGYLLDESDNLYRARPIYFNWGSNSLISRQVADIIDLQRYGLRPESAAAYSERGASIINYLHGTNPSGICMLSNMYRYGAEICADEMWHSWFGSDTRFDNLDGDKVGPAPGFITGGPNPQGAAAMPIKLGTYSFNARAGDQPAQKAFSVDNFWQNDPWAYNEPAIYYQAAYVKALSYFVGGLAAGGATGQSGMPADYDCAEAENVFTVANDTGSNAAVEVDGNSPGATAGTSVKLFDAGDAAAVTITVPAGADYDLAVRVRVGEAAGDAGNLVDQYTLTLDGEELAYQLDPTSVTALRGDTYWGEIVLVGQTLSEGDHELTVTAKSDWLKLDRVCYRNPNSIPEPPTRAEETCLETEAAFTIVNDVDVNGTIRPDNFTGGASGERYINMFDIGDKVSLPFTVVDAGTYELRFRVRVGEAAGTESNLADKYLITIDGDSAAVELDEMSISDLFGDTYWGELVVRLDTLGSGEHAATVEANNEWLKFDRFCFGNTDLTSVFGRPSTLAAGISLQPNPSDGRVRIELELQDFNKDISVRLYDLTGRRLAEQPFRLAAGNRHELRLDYRSLQLPSGIYLLRIAAGAVGIGEVQRLVIE